MTRCTTILPGGTIGMLGGGQLGRMSALAAHQMGFHVIVFASDPGGPGGQVADETVVGGWDDSGAIDRFAKRCDVVTMEWENIPPEAVQRVEAHCPVYPSALVLRVAQDRRREKGTLAGHGLPVTPFQGIDTLDEALAAGTSLGYPLVLKTSRSGYDGKGQAKVDNHEALRQAYQLLGGVSMVAEKWIPFRRELSVIVARNIHGETAVYPLFENRHENHILDQTIFPAPGAGPLASSASHIATSAAKALGVVGILCVELFETEDGHLLINEIAPRPHNSGHVTIEAAETSQFEQHIRAVCGLPLGSTAVRRPGAMVNLLGDVWETRSPAFPRILGEPETHLHLYGKRQPRVGRKMGHITVLNDNWQEAARRALAARARL